MDLLANFGIHASVLLDSGIPNLESSDNSYIHTRSGFDTTFAGFHNMEMSILAETIGLNPTIIDLRIKSHIDEPAGLAQIRMKNFNTKNFDIVNTHAIGNVDGIELIARLDASKYYNTNNGRMRGKIKHLVFVPFLAFTFESFLDQVEIVVE